MHEEGKTMSLDTSSITNRAHRTVFTPNLGQKSKEQNRSVFIWFGAAIYISLPKAHECWKDAGTGGGQGSFLAKHYFISSAFLRHHTKTAQSQGVMIWYDMRVPCQHCQIQNTLVAVWKSALSAKQQREKSRAMVVHCLQPDAMGCEPPSSSTWNTHSYGPWHTHQPYAAKRGMPGFLPQRQPCSLRWSQVCSWYSQWPQGSHCPTHHHPVPPTWQPGYSLIPVVCVSRAGGVTWICPKLIFPASPLPEPQPQSLGKGRDTRYPRVFLVKTSTWVCRGKSKTVWHARQINFYALPAVTSPSRHGGCFLWRV